MQWPRTFVCKTNRYFRFQQKITGGNSTFCLHFQLKIPGKFDVVLQLFAVHALAAFHAALVLAPHGHAVAAVSTCK